MYFSGLNSVFIISFDEKGDAGREVVVHDNLTSFDVNGFENGISPLLYS